MNVLYCAFKKESINTINGILFFPENIDNNNLTLMVGDDLLNMDMMARRIIKCSEKEIILRKIIN